jgi:predicted RNA-binding protein YlqC (UPF0109 family)
MTRNRGFKRLVRQRAAKTGESYAIAFRQLRDSKEKSVTTPETTEQTCRLCSSSNTPESALLRGRVSVCRNCHARFREVLRAHLEPVALEHAVSLDSIMGTLVYDVPKEGQWYVHLHTFLPGLVIGRRGVTAAAIRASLVELTGDDRFHLNLVEHGHPGCWKKPEDQEETT